MNREKIYQLKKIIHLPALAFWSLFAVLFYALISHPLRINHDVAILLQTGQLLWDGGMPYVDFIELDPPMIMYLNTIPIMISRAFGINSILALSLMIASFNVWSALQVQHLLRKSKLKIKENDAYALAISFALFSLWARITFDWGQRDYLFTLALIPYLLIRFIRNEGGFVSKPSAFAVGILTAIFTVLKHYFLILIIAPEIFYIFHKKSFRQVFSIETCVLAGGIALYIIHFFFLPAAMRDAYFGKWAPMLVQYYETYNASYYNMIMNVKFYLLLSCIVTFAACLWSFFYKTTLTRLTTFLSFAFLASLLLFFIPHKGFTYHLLPAMGIFSLVAGILAVEILFKKTGEWFANTFYLLLCAASFLFILLPRHPMELGPLEKVISTYTNENERVLIISTSIFDAYPVTVQMNRKLGSRYTTAFPIAFFSKDRSEKNTRDSEIRYAGWEEASLQEKDFIHDLLQDIQNFKPPLILINKTHHCQACPENFSIYEYLKHLGFLRELLKNYQIEPATPDFAVLIPKARVAWVNKKKSQSTD